MKSHYVLPIVAAILVSSLVVAQEEGEGELVTMKSGLQYIDLKIGYGKRGAGEVIPPGADLIFEVELLAVE